MSVILETDRLILRHYTEDDAPAFFQLNSDPEVMRYVPDQPIIDVDEARKTLVAYPIADYSRHGYGRWACCLKATGAHIGFCGLKHLPETGEVDLGFRLMQEQWGKGLATEAARGCVQYGFAELHLHEIVGLSHPDNHGSISVLEKIGMQFTGIVSPYGWPMRRYRIGRSAGPNSSG
jgi:[ribosomal protein S5]-alanine N-acetyltransferase